jgi:hypothetical protein
MSLFPPLFLGLLLVPKSSLLKIESKMQDYGRHPIVISVFLGLVVLYAALCYPASSNRRLPPGPRGYPIIGNILDLRSAQWLKFAEWRKEYGQFLLTHTHTLSLSVLSWTHSEVAFWGPNQAMSSTSTRPDSPSSSSTRTKRPATCSIDARRRIRIGRATSSPARS